MVINSETHNWPRHRKQETAECSALNRSCIPLCLLPRFMDHFRIAEEWVEKENKSQRG